MWIVRWVVVLLVILFVLGFALQNQTQMVNVQLFGWESGDIPLYLALFVSFGFGMIAFLLVAVFQQLQALTELSKTRRAGKKLAQRNEELEKELETVKEELELASVEKSRLGREVALLEERLREQAGVSAPAPAQPRTEEEDEEEEPPSEADETEDER